MKHFLTLSVFSLVSFLFGAAVPESATVIPEKDAPQEAKDAPVQVPAGDTITLGVPRGVKNLVLVFNSGKRIFIRLDKLEGVKDEKPD